MRRTPDADPTNPLIVQCDLSILVEVSSPRYDDARGRLARFAELEKSPEHIHTYRISPLSLWNAAVGRVVSRRCGVDPHRLRQVSGGAGACCPRSTI